jgi:hypothetical protein
MINAFLHAQSDRQWLNLADSKDFRGMNLLDSALQSGKIMVIGINRAYPEINRTIGVKLVSYARTTAGYRHFLAPVSPICGEWLNRFVFRNDYSVMPDLTMVLSQEDLLFYKRLNALNEGVADSLKIQIMGIDAENRTLIPALGIFNLFKDKTPPNGLRIPIEALQGAIRYQQIKNGYLDKKYDKDQFPVKNTYREFVKNFDSVQNLYQQWLGDDEWLRLDALMTALKSSLNYEKWTNTSLEDPFRVQQVAENIKKHLQNQPNEKFICIVGRCYAANSRLQGACELYDFLPVCGNLREDNSLAGQVFNMGIYYDNPRDAEDEPLEILSALTQIRTSVTANAAVLSHTKHLAAKNAFDFMLVMGNNRSYQPLAAIKKRKTIPVFSVGISSGIHMVNLNKLNGLLKDNGLSEVNSTHDFGINMTIWDNSGNHFESGFFQSARAPGSPYQYWGTYVSGVGNLSPQKKGFRSGLGGFISYQQHVVNGSTNLNDTAFITRYSLPSTAVNPALIFGLKAKLAIHIKRCYLALDAGYGWDLSDQRWRVNNKFSGPAGTLKGDQFFVNFCAGLHLIRKPANKRKGNTT